MLTLIPFINPIELIKIFSYNFNKLILMETNYLSSEVATQTKNKFA